MNYPQTLEYLFSRLPMFHRIGVAAYKADLNNIIALSELLNNPEKKFRSIHVAGTNGKGSVTHMLASVLQEAGYKTGLFTSPHLKDFRERIRINGRMIGEETITNFVEKYKHSFDEIKPSFFEWTTALAFKFFADEKVDIAVIETGLGGRLDSTNIIFPELSVITNISYDHMPLLGDSLGKIAFEKAGIIKKNVPVVIGERQKESEEVFIKKADEMDTSLVFASENYKSEVITLIDEGQKFRIREGDKILYDELLIDLSGNYQAKNICTVLQSLEILKKLFPKINENNIKNGLRKVSESTGLQGRWQVIGRTPLTIVDVAHNEAGIKLVMDQLNTMRETFQTSNAPDSHRDQTPIFQKLHIVFGIVNDKNPSHILSHLPKHATYYFCKADIPRALDANELKNTASSFNIKGESYPSVKAALHAAQNNADKDDLVFVGGSTFVVAEAI